MSHAPSRSVQAVFTTGPLMRHVAVMTATGSIGLMAVFVVDLLSLLYVSWLGRDGAWFTFRVPRRRRSRLRPRHPR